MLTFENGSSFGSFSRLTIRAKTFTASAVVVICLIGMGVAASMTSSKVARDLNELSHSNLPTRAAAAAVNNAVITAHMSVFRYVSWASNGVNGNLLRVLRKEIEGDFSVIGDNFKNLSGRPDLSALEKS